MYKIKSSEWVPHQTNCLSYDYLGKGIGHVYITRNTLFMIGTISIRITNTLKVLDLPTLYAETFQNLLIAPALHSPSEILHNFVARGKEFIFKGISSLIYSFIHSEANQN